VDESKLVVSESFARVEDGCELRPLVDLVGFLILLVVNREVVDEEVALFFHFVKLKTTSSENPSFTHQTENKTHLLGNFDTETPTFVLVCLGVEFSFAEFITFGHLFAVVLDETESGLAEFLVEFLGVDEASTTTEGVRVGTKGERLVFSELQQDRAISVDLEVKLVTIGRLEELFLDEFVASEEVPRFVLRGAAAFLDCVGRENSETAFLEPDKHLNQLLEVVGSAAVILQEVVIVEVGRKDELGLLISLQVHGDSGSFEIDDFAMFIFLGVLTNFVERIDGDETDKKRFGFPADGEGVVGKSFNGSGVVPNAELLYFSVVGIRKLFVDTAEKVVDVFYNLLIFEESRDVDTICRSVNRCVDSARDETLQFDIFVLSEDRVGFGVVGSFGIEVLAIIFKTRRILLFFFIVNCSFGDGEILFSGFVAHY
jgi:hypothetical protein